MKKRVYTIVAVWVFLLCVAIVLLNLAEPDEGKQVSYDGELFNYILEKFTVNFEDFIAMVIAILIFVPWFGILIGLARSKREEDRYRNMVFKSNADRYLKKETFRLTGQKDIYLYTDYSFDEDITIHHRSRRLAEKNSKNTGNGKKGSR